MEPNQFPNEAIDLSQFDEAFASASADDEGVPDSKYKINIEKVELARSQTSGRPMVKWGLRVLDGEHAGRLLWRNNVLITEENAAWLKKDLKKCGLEIEKLSDLPNHLERLLDVRMLVSVKTNGEYTNIYFNRRLTDGEVAGATGTPF